ncbi:MAG: aminoacyl-tRNA hydrolase [Candidatus Dadabacteria bacterium]|nr:MAG: aminoacyl-tRNA hydrolase [Candidatus Dadabacteria bacterium]
MRLIVGLGNPGKKYEGTRHNAGFMLLDRLVAAYIPGERWTEKFGSLCIQAVIEGQKCILLKPQTYMNCSGRAVSECVRFYKIPLDAVTVAHDDIDLPLGRLRIKKGGGDGGHNGLKSITSALADDGYIRLRLGVGRPPQATEEATRDDVISSWVLSRFSRDQLEVFNGMLERAVKAAVYLGCESVEAVQNRFNAS